MESVSKIDGFDIFKMYNRIPSFSLSKEIKLNVGDFVLLEGQTGQGKTTFFKFLKGK
jgi:tRNA A37 threonylcarbamoyladenosine biosynthesis protein TsaE